MLLSLVEIYLVILGWAYLSLDRLVFRPPVPSYAVEQVSDWVDTPDGERLALLIREVSGSPLTVLYTHGNAEDLGQVAFFLAWYAELGVSVVSWDYRGYGQSSGKASVRACYRDAETVFNYLHNERGIRPEQILLHGRSVGAVPAVYLAARHDTAGLVIESGFTSAFRVLTRHRIVPYEPMNNLRRLKQVDEPVLVLHGEADRTIPFRHGKQLFRASVNPRALVSIPGAGHDNLLDLGEDRVRAALMTWLDTLVRQEEVEAGERSWIHQG